MTITVRGPRPGDGAAIARLHLANSAYYVSIAPAFFRLPDEDGLVDFFERGIAEDATRPDSLSLVAEVDGEVAGYLEAQLQQPLETARWQSGPDLSEVRLYINALGTAPAYQRRGVGTRLVEAAEEWGRERGATVATCDTFADSPLSVPFWQVRMRYEPRAIVLRKPLASDARGSAELTTKQPP